MQQAFALRDKRAQATSGFWTYVCPLSQAHACSTWKGFWGKELRTLPLLSELKEMGEKMAEAFPGFRMGSRRDLLSLVTVGERRRWRGVS